MRALIDRLVDRIAAGLALVGAIGVVVMLLHITAYVAMRLFFSAPIPATVEIVSTYYMVVVAFLPLAWAERRGDMIAIEVFASFYKGIVGKGVDIFVAFVTAGAYAILTYTTWLVAMREAESGAFVMSLSVAIPTWPGYFALPVGFALAAVVALHRLASLLFPASAAAAGVRP
jgi:TRAP-type C4-dicarboxylate transport system permease small subunit